MKPSIRLTLVSDVMRKAEATRRQTAGVPTSSGKSSDGGPMVKLWSSPVPPLLDYYGGYVSKTPNIESERKRKKGFDWLTWGVGFLCGLLTMLILR